MSEYYGTLFVKLKELDDELIRISADGGIMMGRFECPEGIIEHADIRIDIPTLRISLRLGYLIRDGRKPVGIVLVYDLYEKDAAMFRYFIHSTCMLAVKNYLRVEDSSVPFIECLACGITHEDVSGSKPLLTMLMPDGPDGSVLLCS